MKKERPILQNLKTEPSMSKEEVFQNEVLRPIIKMQHDLLIAYFKNHITYRKNDFNNNSEENQIKFIHRTFQSDTNFKHELKGLIIGHFKVAEFETYLSLQQALNKRIFGIVKERLLSSLPELH